MNPLLFMTVCAYCLSNIVFGFVCFNLYCILVLTICIFCILFFALNIELLRPMLIDTTIVYSFVQMYSTIPLCEFTIFAGGGATKSAF